MLSKMSRPLGYSESKNIFNKNNNKRKLHHVFLLEKYFWFKKNVNEKNKTTEKILSTHR